MTKEQVEKLELGIAPIDSKVIIIVASGLEWIKANTTLEFDIDNEENLKALPYSVRLFLLKFFDIQELGTGVSSESMEGMSQSFDTGDREAMLWQYAKELLGDYLKPRVRFIAAQDRWA